ncbi:MAG: hypothetical protein V1902_03400 [Candidatus Falkowbacteria bacterium]
MFKRATFWLYVAKFYLSLRRSAIFYGLIVVIIVQSIFFILTFERVNKLQASLATYQDNTSMMLNRIYSQVFLLNTRVNQVLEKK